MIKAKYLARAPSCIFIALIVATATIFSFADSTIPFQGLPKVTLQLSSLDSSGNLIYIGIDFAVFEEVDSQGDPNDIDGDGKVFKAKEGKVKRFLTTHTNITIDLGDSKDYKKGIRHKLGMRTLYTPAGTSAGEIIIASQSNGADGWIEIDGSDFQLSYFEPIDEGNRLVQHTAKWEENRQAYNLSKVKSHIVSSGVEARLYNTFWSGEKFLIRIPTTEQVDALRIGIYESTGAGITSKYTTDLTSYIPNPDDPTTGAIYLGELWEAEMLMEWGNYSPQMLTFKIDAIVSGSAVETIEYPIMVDNRELFYRIRRSFR